MGVSVDNPSIVLAGKNNVICEIQKNELFIVPVAMDRQQKLYLWCRPLKWIDTKN
jgi:hypothetical protein